MGVHGGHGHGMSSKPHVALTIQLSLHPGPQWSILPALAPAVWTAKGSAPGVVDKISMSCETWPCGHAVWHSGQCSPSTPGVPWSPGTEYCTRYECGGLQCARWTQSNETQAREQQHQQTQTLLLLPLLLAKLRPSRHFQSPHTVTRQDKFRIDASEPSLSLAYREGRPPQDRPAPSWPPSSCIQLPFPAPDPAQVRWALPTPPYPPSLSQSQHAGRPLPCRYLRYDILLPASQICLGNHLSQQCPLTGCFAFLLLLILFLASLHTHHPYSPPPSHFTWSLIQSLSLSAVCHLRTISQGLVTGSSVLSCLSSEPPSVDIVCPGDIHSGGGRETRSPLQTLGSPRPVDVRVFVVRGFVVRAEPSAYSTIPEEGIGMRGGRIV